jgi:ribosomal protein S18 acetylase RimI-like enzyme
MNIRLATNHDEKVIISLANQVYYTSEREFWKEGYYRIDEQEYNHHLTNNLLFVGELDNEIVGVILMKQVDKTTTAFSMLICHPNHRKKGIGKTLVNHVLKTAKEKSYQKMQLEILSPLNWVHTEKEFLKTWYKSIGFKLIKEVNFLDYYPTQDKYMKCPLLFSLYEKDLCL